MIESVITTIVGASTVISPLWLSLLGSFVEEIIAPIPSPLIMSLLGSIAASLGKSWYYLLLLAFVGSIGKTIGSYVFYKAADILEDAVLKRFSSKLGITHDEIKAFGAKLSGGWKDDLTIFLFRATPILPTTPVSIAAGILKVDRKSYIRSTIAGFFVRNLFYLSLGYKSLSTLEKISTDLAGAELIGSVLTLIFIGSIFVYIYYQKKRRSTLG